MNALLAIVYGQGGGGSSATYWVVVAIAAFVVIAAGAWLFMRRRDRRPARHTTRAHSPHHPDSARAHRCTASEDGRRPRASALGRAGGWPLPGRVRASVSAPAIKRGAHA